MAVPRAVKKQAEDALKEFEQKKADEQAARQAEQVTQIPVNQSTPLAVTTAEPVRKVEQTDWEERYKRYKASTDVTTHELRTQNAEMAQAIQQLTAQVQELTRKAEQKPAPTLTVDELFTEEERNTYDDEYRAMLLRITEKQAKHVADMTKAEMEAQLSGRISQLEGNVKQVATNQSRSAIQVYEDALDAAVPDWVAIGEEEAFETWLGNNTVSPLDKRTYGQAMKQAHNALDAQSVIYILKEYLQQRDGRKPNLESQITPAGTGGGEVLDEGRVYTESEISQYHTDCTRGKYTQKQRVEIDRSIKEAIQAGRVRPG